MNRAMYRLMTLRGVIHGGTGRHEKNKSDKKKKARPRKTRLKKIHIGKLLGFQFTFNFIKQAK